MEILQVVPNPDISPVLFQRNPWLYFGVAVVLYDREFLFTDSNGR
jgi:hypothetical protein